MATNTNPPFPGGDPFSAMWTEWMSKFGNAAGAGPAPGGEVAAQMRKAFFDTMSQHADQYMRSEAFLSSMKQSMDNALGWQQMVNQFLQKGVAAAQMPTRTDAEHVVRLIRGMEDRLIARLESMATRVARLEQAAGVQAPKSAGRKRSAKPAKGTK